MQISTRDWKNYINKLAMLNNKAGEEMQRYVARNGFADTDALIDFCYAIVTKYGEGSAELACQMYDAIAEMANAAVDAAVPAATATYAETARAIQGSLLQSPTGQKLTQVANRLVKQAAADTTLQNAIRDHAQWAWIPSGDTCGFCITLASNGWQRASKRVLRGNHATHIHANCDCMFAIRFSENDNVKGYDPDYYKKLYDEAPGGSSSEKVKALRRQLEDRDKINAQKRNAYKEKKLRENLSQNKNDKKIFITDISIDKVKEIKINSYTTEELAKIKELNVNILKNAQQYNGSNEVAMLIDKNWQFSKPVFGNEKEVDFLKDSEFSDALRNSPLRSIVLSHNHPSLSYFSSDDIGIFIGYPSIKTMEIVTNAGKTWHITKKPGYNDLEMLELYKKVVKSNKNQPLDKIVDDFLKRSYNQIERNR